MSERETIGKNYQLLFLIVNDAVGSALVRLAKKNGVTGGTVFYGYGTIRNSALKFLGLQDIRKEIVLMVAEEEIADSLLNICAKRLKLDKPNHGIAFTIPLMNVLGRRDSVYHEKTTKEENGTMHQAIFTIVERGRADDVIEAAEAAGSKGGTIINARGSGIHETSRVFAMDIEPEKEIVLVLAESDKVEPIVTSISNAIQIEQPGNGILFTADVNEAKGLFE